MRIGVDVDGTLTLDKNRYWVGHEECSPNNTVIEEVNELYNSNHTIIIHTARPWKNASSLVAWLNKHGVKYHGIRMDKGSCDLYIDDKSVNHLDLIESKDWNTLYEKTAKAQREDRRDGNE